MAHRGSAGKKKNRRPGTSIQPVRSPAPVEPPDPTNPFLVWVRLMVRFMARTGPAFVVAGSSMIPSSYYWMGVATVYIGLALCIIDIFIDPLILKHSLLMRFTGLAILIVLAGFFSIKVVFVTTPLEVFPSVRPGVYPPGTVIADIKWIPEFTDLRVALSNPTGSDYEKIDIVLAPDQPIAKIGQVSTIPGVSFIGDATREQVDIGGVIVMRPDLTRTDADGRITNIPIVQFLAPRYRVRCKEIPKYSSVELTLAICGFERDKGAYTRRRPTKIRVNGTYTAAFRERTIDETIVIFAPEK